MIERKIEETPEKIDLLKRRHVMEHPRGQRFFLSSGLTKRLTAMDAEFCIVLIGISAMLAKHIDPP